jgi:hypothetical protein
VGPGEELLAGVVGGGRRFEDTDMVASPFGKQALVVTTHQSLPRGGEEIQAIPSPKTQGNDDG